MADNKIYSLNDIYSEDEIIYQSERYHKAVLKFRELYGDVPFRLFSAPGRTEIGGNHTDHNHGKVLAAAVSLDVIAVVEKTDDSIIKIRSEGFPVDVVDISDLSVKPADINTSSALIRGVAEGFVKTGYKSEVSEHIQRQRYLKAQGFRQVLLLKFLWGQF